MNDLEYTFYWPMFLLCLGLGVAILFLALFMGKQHPAANPNARRLAASHPEYQSLGGWLILPLISLTLKALGGIILCVGYGFIGFNELFWSELVEIGGKEYSLIYLEAIFLLFAVKVIWPAFFLPVLLVQFFRRKTVVPAMVVVHTLTMLFITLGLMVLFMLADPGEGLHNASVLFAQFFVACLFSLPWVVYFIQSKRVKAFFCR